MSFSAKKAVRTDGSFLKNNKVRNKTSKRTGLGPKAQISMEYLAIFAIAFLMTFPLIVMYVSQTNNVRADVTQVETYRIATKILDYAEEVYFMGEPSQRTLTLDFPAGINNITITQNMITFNITTTDLNYVVEKDTPANLSGYLSSYEGKHVIVFRAQNTFINITER